MGIDNALNAGLDIFIQTVVTHSRLHSQEFINFVQHFNNMGLGVFVTYAKPVGAWQGHFEQLVTKDDMQYMRQLEKTYNLYTHLTPAYGRDMGCIAVKGMISITEYGDVLPCPYIHVSIGNIVQNPLKDIIQKGLSIKWFGQFSDTCVIAQDRDFINNYIVKGVYNKQLPVLCDEVFSKQDDTIIPFNEYMKQNGKV